MLQEKKDQLKKGNKVQIRLISKGRASKAD
jgi:hypothetical protein